MGCPSHGAPILSLALYFLFNQKQSTALTPDHNPPEKPEAALDGPSPCLEKSAGWRRQTTVGIAVKRLNSPGVEHHKETAVLTAIQNSSSCTAVTLASSWMSSIVARGGMEKQEVKKTTVSQLVRLEEFSPQCRKSHQLADESESESVVVNISPFTPPVLFGACVLAVFATYRISRALGRLQASVGHALLGPAHAPRVDLCSLWNSELRSAVGQPELIVKFSQVDSKAIIREVVWMLAQPEHNCDSQLAACPSSQVTSLAPHSASLVAAVSVPGEIGKDQSAGTDTSKE
ncbi:hypothetical protein DFH08DRAFT_826787 [Mycena albidolilacea]|uniref:Uncharacterized protein n=1 Tax=Mycena albidolilacea TaxID=1033008 RepID=A0AAD7E8L2_9AGAR|nr:hypothetical protein DFH08DRAFT_826787 [Mycena albidolilacea]